MLGAFRNVLTADLQVEAARGANGRPAHFSEGTDTRKHTLCGSDHNKAPLLAPVLFLKCEHKKSYIPVRNNGLNTAQPQGVKSNTKDSAI